MATSPSPLLPVGLNSSQVEGSIRADLAAAFRWCARLNLHESVANHFSAAVSEDGSTFLINPCRRHFSRIRARDLLLLSAHDHSALQRPNAPDRTAWYLHSELHAHLPRARCVLHVHSPFATALGCLSDSSLLPIDMNTARFYGRVAVDEEFGGMALSREEAARQARILGDGKTVLLLANHGVVVVGPSVAEAFDELYYFERAAQTLLACYATGKPLRVISTDLARLTERQWAEYSGFAQDHWRELRGILDAHEPDYAD
jgi:ribulose-5-phosphate 4-epimerase/fuculose-1-phosphate aldolase